MTDPTPQQILDLREFARAVADTLATALHAADCGCPDWSPGDDEDPRYDTAAGQALIDWTYGGQIREEWGYRLTYNDGQVKTRWVGTGDRDEEIAREVALSPRNWSEPGRDGEVLRRFVITTAAGEVTE